ncbi:MAG: hypothetical protein ACK44U_04250 [Sphingobacteriales bacterium]
MRTVFLAILTLIVSSCAFAQNTTLPPIKSEVWRPWVILEGGLVWGSYETNGDVRLQSGISKEGWKFGAGIGHDSYRYSSLPIYLQARKIFVSGKKRPFVLASAGYNFATEPDFSPDWWFDPRGGITPVYKYGSGYYAELGGGLAFRENKKWGYTLSISYIRKTMSEEYNTTIWNGTGLENEVINNLYRMKRVSIRLGIRIGR